MSAARDASQSSEFWRTVQRAVRDAERMDPVQREGWRMALGLPQRASKNLTPEQDLTPNRDPKVAPAPRRRRLPRIRPLFAWYDLWVGAYWDRRHARLYLLPVPTLGIVIDFQQSGGGVEEGH